MGVEVVALAHARDESLLRPEVEGRIDLILAIREEEPHAAAWRALRYARTRWLESSRTCLGVFSTPPPHRPRPPHAPSVQRHAGETSSNSLRAYSLRFPEWASTTAMTR